MIYYIDRINMGNEINWMCKVWSNEHIIGEIVFKKLYKEYTGKNFPNLKIMNRIVLEERDLRGIMNKLREDLNEIILYLKDERVKESEYIIRNFLNDICDRHYIFDVVIIEEGD